MPDLTKLEQFTLAALQGITSTNNTRTAVGREEIAEQAVDIARRTLANLQHCQQLESNDQIKEMD